MMLAAHVSAGALAGRCARGPGRAVALGMVTHAALDLVPHEDAFGERTEIAVTAALVTFVAAISRDVNTVAGAIGGALPDLEHVLPVPGLGGRPVFPTHVSSRLHGALPLRFRAGSTAQLGLAAVLLAAALAGPHASKRPKDASPS
jgi:hypothetical protein